MQNTNQDTLVVYFSATGTTKSAAERIAAVTGADIYEIQAAQAYTPDDLNWRNRNSRTTREQNDPSSRPEIGSGSAQLDRYRTVFIGYPIWWGVAPRIVDTFVESNSFDGIDVIPFCTSGGSGVGRSAANLAQLAGSGSWRAGREYRRSATDEELKSWAE